MDVAVREITASDEQRWRVLWDGYLRFYETDLAGTTAATWRRLLDPGSPISGLVADRGVSSSDSCTAFPPLHLGRGRRVLPGGPLRRPGDARLGAGRRLIEAVVERARARDAAACTGTRIWTIARLESSTTRSRPPTTSFVTSCRFRRSRFKNSKSRAGVAWQVGWVSTRGVQCARLCCCCWSACSGWSWGASPSRQGRVGSVRVPSGGRRLRHADRRGHRVGRRRQRRRRPGGRGCGGGHEWRRKRR